MKIISPGSQIAGLLIFFIIFGCSEKVEYYYCNDIKCSSGKYIIKEYSKDFFRYVKDSINYRIERGNDNSFSDRAFFVVDSLMSAKKYISDEEKTFLRRLDINTERTEGLLGEEFCINYKFQFKNLKELKKLKIAFAKWKSSWMILMVDGYAKNNKQAKGISDTLKNAKLMKELIVENNGYLVIKNKKLYYRKSPKRKIDISFKDSVHIIFPKPIKEAKGIHYRLSKDRKTIMILDTICGRKTIEEKYCRILINFKK